MSREKIEVRECDRCKTKVEARELDSFADWGFATATGEKDGRKTGFSNADLCPGCFDFLYEWFAAPTRERDAARAPSRRRRDLPTTKEIAAKLIADNLSASPELDEYLAALDGIASLDELQEFQAKNALKLMEWMAAPQTAERLMEGHRAAYERLEAVELAKAPSDG